MDIFHKLFTDTSIYFNLFDQIADEVFIFNTNACLQYLNKAAEKSEGFQLSKVKGKSIFELYDFEHDLTEERSPALIALKKEQSVHQMVCPYYVNNKENIKVISSAPIYQDGILVGAYTVQHDLSQINEIVKENILLQQTISKQKERKSDNDDPFSSIIGNSIGIQTCINIAKQAAQTSSSVMLEGETGTGKEVFAHAIHDSSNRTKKPFLALNCAAIPESLVESILFGTTKGAFTDAVEKSGILAQADGGTVFLDEINSMPLSSQAKLLRVLEEKKIMKLGSSKAEPVNIRIICSINESPQKAIENKHIREDLFYRLSVVQIHIPPLRERKEDIPILSDHFIQTYNLQFGKEIPGIDRNTLDFFMNYTWPGNVRQLKACIESSMNFTPDRETIPFSVLPQYLKEKNEAPTTIKPVYNPIPEMILSTTEPFSKEKLRRKKSEQEKQEIIDALSHNSGNVSKASKELGISRSLLYYRLKKYQLN